ncbi:MAG: hypothetical protein ISS77_08465 [Phycisphaerae bacterium]|nr:hypothetical protein [Phycisphaerae bacterium]
MNHGTIRTAKPTEYVCLTVNRRIGLELASAELLNGRLRQQKSTLRILSRQTIAVVRFLSLFKAG